MYVIIEARETSLIMTKVFHLVFVFGSAKCEVKFERGTFKNLTWSRLGKGRNLIKRPAPVGDKERDREECSQIGADNFCCWPTEWIWSGAHKFEAYGPMNARRWHLAAAAVSWPRRWSSSSSSREPEIGAANIGFKDDDLAFCCWPVFYLSSCLCQLAGLSFNHPFIFWPFSKTTWWSRWPIDDARRTLRKSETAWQMERAGESAKKCFQPEAQR